MYQTYAARAQIYGPPAKPRIRQRAKYRLLEFLRPDCFWPSPYTIEQAVGVMEWMHTTAEPYTERGRWGTQSPFDLLARKPTCVGHNAYPEPIVSIFDLRSGFHYALLSAYASNAAMRWRREIGITLDAEHWIAFPHYVPFQAERPEADMEKLLSGLFSASGQLARNEMSYERNSVADHAVPCALNPCHPDATNIYGVTLNLHAKRKYSEFVLSYGFDGSVWRHTLATFQDGEPFYDTLTRAVSELERLKTPIVRETADVQNREVAV